MILFGASGHAKVIIDILEKQGVMVEFLVDANAEIKEIQGYKVLHENDFENGDDDEIIISIGSNKIRKKVSQTLNMVYGWALHPSAVLGDDVIIGQGTVVMAGSVINSSSDIGNHVIINTNASVDHDCELKDFIHISPNATLCGGVKIGEGTHVGAGATITPNLIIGEWVTIGAGAVVIDNIPDNAVVVGNPSRIIKYNDPEI